MNCLNLSLQDDANIEPLNNATQSLKVALACCCGIPIAEVAFQAVAAVQGTTKSSISVLLYQKSLVAFQAASKFNYLLKISTVFLLY